MGAGIEPKGLIEDVEIPVFPSVGLEILIGDGLFPQMGVNMVCC